MPSLTSLCATLSPFYSTDNWRCWDLPPLSPFSNAMRIHQSSHLDRDHHSFVTAWISSRIICRPSVPSPRYLTSGISWTFSLSHDSFSSMSMTPLSTVRAALLMTSLYASAITAVAFWWVIAIIVPFVFRFTFIIRIWAGTFWWKRAVLVTNTISWSILLDSCTPLSVGKTRCLNHGWSGYWGGAWAGEYPLTLGTGLVYVPPSGRSGCWLRFQFLLLVRLLVELQFGFRFGCCCSERFSGLKPCMARPHCKATRLLPSPIAVLYVSSFLVSRVGAASPTLALASTFTVMSPMTAPQSSLPLSWSSYFFTLPSSHSFMPCHCASLCAMSATSILAILSIVWCSWVTSCSCCLTVRSMRLLQSPSARTGSEVSFLSLVPFLLCSHCALAAMKDTIVVFSDLWPAAPLASPAFAMSLSLSVGGFLIIPPIGLIFSGCLPQIQDVEWAWTIHTAAVPCRIAAPKAAILRVLLLLTIELTAIKMSESGTNLGAITAVMLAGNPSRWVITMTIKINLNPQGEDCR